MPHPESEDMSASYDGVDEDIDLPDAPPADTSEDDSKKSTAKSALPARETTLEELFDDDDDEYGMDDIKDEKLLVGAMHQTISALELSASDPDVLSAFYQRLLPCRTLFQWLNHSPVPTNDFAHREFAFTLPNDVYLRYQSYTSGDLFRRDLLRHIPKRFEIGSIYNTNPRDRFLAHKAALYPIEKELVFDIDLTDYDGVRTCCVEANICCKCWSFMTVAIHVIDVALKEDLGYKHVLWVYSGRRGVHAWVCDKRARVLDDTKRKAIVSYLEVLKGGHRTKKVNIKRPLHPHVLRSLNILKEEFQSRVLEGQDPWRDMEQAELLLKQIPDKDLVEGLRKKWNSHYHRPSLQKWEDIDSLAKTGISKNLDRKLLLESKQDIILEYMYPRLDAQVSKDIKHLLKSPFCIHPGTGHVCVPIDAAKAEEFDPLSVPTVTKLLEEINRWDLDRKVKTEGVKLGGEGGAKIPDYEKTSLKPYVEFFRAFVASLIRDEKGMKKDGGGIDSMEF